MHIQLVDTQSAYRTLLTLPPAARAAYFRDSVIAPFASMFKAMQLPQTPEALAALPLAGCDDAMQSALAAFSQADA